MNVNHHLRSGADMGNQRENDLIVEVGFQLLRSLRDADDAVAMAEGVGLVHYMQLAKVDEFSIRVVRAALGEKVDA